MAPTHSKNSTPTQTCLAALIACVVLGTTTAPLALAKPKSGYTYFQQLTGDDADSDKSRWDSVYSKSKGYLYGKEPALFLVENLSLLPVGRALDLAMGEGRNAVYLAQKGFEVVGVDISDVAVRKARRLARENNVRIKTVVSDLNRYPIAPESYDVIVVFYYLQRSLVPAIVRGLKPGGVLIFEAETVDSLKHDRHRDKSQLLEKGELRVLFKDLTEVKYAETDGAKKAVASLVAKKPLRQTSAPSK